LLIQDANELFDYNPDNIDKISVVNQPYVYGPRTFSGVINITTKNSDYQTKSTGDFMKVIDIQRPANTKYYYNPQHSEKANNRIPDYRYQLLWFCQNTMGKIFRFTLPTSPELSRLSLKDLPTMERLFP